MSFVALFLYFAIQYIFFCPSTVSSSSYRSLAASAIATATVLLASFFFLFYSTLSACSFVCSHCFFNSFFSLMTNGISSFHHHSSLSVLCFPDVSPSTSLATFLSTLALFSHQSCTLSSVVVNLFSTLVLNSCRLSGSLNLFTWFSSHNTYFLLWGSLHLNPWSPVYVVALHGLLE